MLYYSETNDNVIEKMPMGFLSGQNDGMNSFPHGKPIYFGAFQQRFNLIEKVLKRQEQETRLADVPPTADPAEFSHRRVSGVTA
jgi:hypothetical protein